MTEEEIEKLYEKHYLELIHVNRGPGGTNYISSRSHPHVSFSISEHQPVEIARLKMMMYLESLDTSPKSEES